MSDCFAVDASEDLTSRQFELHPIFSTGPTVIMPFRLVSFCCALLASGSLFSQISCSVVDQTGAPVSFAYVQAPELDLLTVTTSEGKFFLPEKLTDTEETIKISCLGYETKEVTLKTLLKSDGIVVLAEASHLLQQVVVSEKKLNFKERSFGISRPKLGSRQGYNFSTVGYERGIVVSNDRLCQISEIEFHTSNIGVDAFKVEFNFYDYSNDSIGKRLQTDRIIRDVLEAEENSLLSVKLAEPISIEGPFVVTIANLATEPNVVAMLESKNTNKYKRIDKTAAGWRVYEKNVPLIKVVGRCSKQ